VLQKFYEDVIKTLSYNQWAYVCIAFSFLGSALFLLFYFTESSSRKRLYFVTSIFSFVLLLLSMMVTYKEYNIETNSKYAIVFSQQIDIKNAPSFGAGNIFELHEGTKVRVLDKVDNWCKIKIIDGRIGWVSSNEIKLLN